MQVLTYPIKLTDKQYKFLDKLFLGFYINITNNEHSIVRNTLLKKEYNKEEQKLFNDLRKKVLEKLNEQLR